MCQIQIFAKSANYKHLFESCLNVPNCPYESKSKSFDCEECFKCDYIDFSNLIIFYKYANISIQYMLFLPNKSRTAIWYLDRLYITIFNADYHPDLKRLKERKKSLPKIKREGQPLFLGVLFPFYVVLN